MEIPPGKLVEIWDRSGMGFKGIHRFGGVIDFKFSVRAETEFSRISDAATEEMPKLINSVESKEKMRALQEKFTRNKLIKNENINKNVDKEVDKLMDDDHVGVVFDMKNCKKTKKKVVLKFEKEDEKEEFINEIDMN